MCDGDMATLKHVTVMSQLQELSFCQWTTGFACLLQKLHVSKHVLSRCYLTSVLFTGSDSFETLGCTVSRKKVGNHSLRSECAALTSNT